MRKWVELWHINHWEYTATEVSKKLTGRWKIKDGAVYLEVKRLFFRDWIEESYLKFEDHTETIFTCNL